MGKKDIPRSVRDGEKALDRLASRFDVPVDGLPHHQLVAIGLALRGHSLVEGIRHSLKGPSPITAHIGLRTLAELVVMTMWIETDPVLHEQLWEAEDDRQRLVMEDNAVEFYRRRKQRPPRPGFSPTERNEIEDRVKAARTAGKAAGLTMRPKGNILPKLDDMVAVVPDAWEAYNMVNRWSLAAAHTGPRSFLGDRLVKREDGQHLQSGTPMPSSAVRGVTVTMCCQLWASVSRQVGLGLEGDIDAIRMRVVTDKPG